ncbi:hypothetical protein ACFV6F_37420 [Kitasatospora phosalacinea]|uniref:hypothetical protein n=1 Tax=Kitasatospora phosalacinea TaxID=2065 RepID=UPI0036488EA1
MGRLEELWAVQRMPIRCGLFRADGTGREVDCDGAELTRFAVGEPFGPDAADPAASGWTHADVVAEAVLPDGSGRLVGGGGAHGSDGFFARIGAGGELRWLVHLLCNELVEGGGSERRWGGVDSLSGESGVRVCGARPH